MRRAEPPVGAVTESPPSTTGGRPIAELDVALLGTGRMGSAMATALTHAGARVTLYNRTRSRAEQLADRIGASVAASAAGAVAEADVIITMVADDDAVRSLYRDRGGVLEGLSPRTVAVDMSTVLPDTIRSLEADVRATGAGILDAPVSGSVPLAEAGTLTLMVGGETADLDRARPALEGLSSRIFHVGPLGTGATIKLAVNAVVFGLGSSIAEALVLAEKAGVERRLAYEVFAASTFRSPFVDYKRESFVDPDTSPVAFSIGLAQKDLRLILELARRVNASMPQAALNLDVLGDTASHIGADRDFAAVAEHLRRGRTDMA
jgi:3-hydroxyisobutyrate dehydrogenase-like beta-hydroxyacid dehydrogenase